MGQGFVRGSWTVLLVSLAAPGCGSSDATEELQPGSGGAAGQAGQGNAGGNAGQTPEAGGAAGASGAAGTPAEPVPYPDPDWPTGAPEAFGLDASALAAAGAVAEKLDSFCLLVIRHGTLVSEQYFHDALPTDTPPSWSIAKSYAGTLVGIAIERGDISSLDQSVADFVPEWQQDERAQITIGNLVSMTSGLSWSAWEDYVSMATFAQDHTAFATNLTADKPPGSEWIYHNGGVQMLEPVFRAATGMSIEQYAEKYLWSRVGMTASWGHDPSGKPTPYANVLATCRDHARLGYLYLHGGKWKDEQVVPSAWVTVATTPSQAENRAYGYLWWLNAETPAMDAMMAPWQGRMSPGAPKDLFAARGFGNQFIDVIPSLDMIVVRFGKDPKVGFDLAAMMADQHFAKHDEILNSVLAAVE